MGVACAILSDSRGAGVASVREGGWMSSLKE